jgi:hypothetical protein
VASGGSDPAGAMRIYKHGGSSEYRGVCWNKSIGTWQVQIRNGARVHHLGYFRDEIHAAKRHDEAAIQLKGTAAKLNFPLSSGKGGELGKYTASEAEVKAAKAAPKVKGLGEPQRLTGPKKAKVKKASAKKAAVMKATVKKATAKKADTKKADTKTKRPKAKPLALAKNGKKPGAVVVPADREARQKKVPLRFHGGEQSSKSSQQAPGKGLQKGQPKANGRKRESNTHAPEERAKKIPKMSPHDNEPPQPGLPLRKTHNAPEQYMNKVKGDSTPPPLDASDYNLRLAALITSSAKISVSQITSSVEEALEEFPCTSAGKARPPPH